LRIIHLGFVREQPVALRSERIDLEEVGVPPVATRINDDFEVVVELLAHIPPQLRSDDAMRSRVMACDPKVHVVVRVQDSNFGAFSSALPFEGLSLPEICDRFRQLPDRIVEASVHLRRALDVHRASRADGLAYRLRWSNLRER
jgi:hypothetical protein